MSLPSGYQRDLQITKPALIRAVKVSIEALSHIPRLIETATLHTERMRDAIDPTMFATDHAVKLASEGMAFRDAYVQAAQSIGDTDASGVDIDASVRERVSPGGCGNLMLDAIEARLTQLAEGA